MPRFPPPACFLRADAIALCLLSCSPGLDLIAVRSKSLIDNTERPAVKRNDRSFGRKAMDKLDKRCAIIRATLELVAEHGFHGAPMALVAERSGVAAGTIYRYFESK